jgi:type III pantothenate kinase
VNGVWVVNIGNTRTTAAVVRGGRVMRRLDRPTGPVSAADADACLARLGPARRVDGAIVASVVPARTAAWRQALRRALRGPVIELTHRRRLGVAVSYPRPAGLGPDRLAGVAAAAARFRGPLIVVDVGTAATFNVVLPGRGFVGGVIAPGPAMMLDYLADRTARLPRLGPGAGAAPRRAIGRSTREAMRIGAAAGYRGLVGGILAALRREPGLARARVIATGGGVRAAFPRPARGVTIVPDLTLLGLAHVFALNRPQRSAEG